MSKLVAELVQEHQRLGATPRDANNAGMETVEGLRLLALDDRLGTDA